MAVNIQKFLPPPGGSLAKTNKTLIKSSSSSSITLSNKSIKNLGIVRDKTIAIDSILKGTLAAEKKKLSESKKQDSSKRREKIEEKLETKPKAESGKIKMPSLPRMGFLDWVKNFIGNIILGYFAVRLVDHLPKIIPIVKFLGQATDFVLGVGGKLLDGLVTFIDWGYKAYDATRGFVKNLFGNDGVKQFEQLSGLLNQFLNLALIAGMVTAGSGGGRGKKGDQSKKGGRSGRGGDWRTEGNVIKGKGGFKQAYDNMLKKGDLTEGEKRVVRDYKRLVKAGYHPDSAANQAFFRNRPEWLSGRNVRGGGFSVDVAKDYRTAARGGVVKPKALLSSVRPFLKRIPLPVVGALIDFGLSVALGENPGRAAFRAIGAGLLGAVGAAAGTVVPVAGNFIGGLLGGAAGDAIGGVIYDFLFGGKSSSAKGKIVKKAGGGIARGGRPQRGVKRTLTRKGRYKRKLTPKKPGDVEANSPGSDVGGEEKLFGLFPNPFKMMQKAADVMNPFKVIQKAGQNLGDSDYFGPILAITSKILLGQKPTQEDYKNVGLGINMLVAKGIDDGKLRGGLAAFAEGGFVDPKTLDAIAQNSDISDWVAKAFKESTETNSQKTLREIQENLRLKPTSKPQELDPTLPVDDDMLPGVTAGQWGPLLDLIASVESGNSYEALNPSTTLPGATKMTISRVAAEAERIGKSKGGTGAVGRYQQLPWYLISRAKAAGLNPDKDLFSPENQDLIVSKVNIEQNRSGRRWLKNEISDEQFMQGLSQEFAAIPNAQGVFYYKRQKSSMTPQKVKEALGKVKKGGYSQKELSQVENVKMGKGYGKGGQKIAGDLGDFMKANKSKIPVTGSIHRHPRHLPWEKSGHSVGSLHYQGRAIDLGGWAPSNKNSGGRDEQAPVIKSILDWNKRNGYSPVQLIHHSPKYRNIGSYQSDHNDHVHVAYEKGGFTKSYPHIAKIAERGREFVIDADSTAAIEGTFPGFLDAINKAKYKDAINVLSNFASYESGSEQIVIVPNTQIVAGSGDAYEGGGGLMISSNESESDPFDSLYVGG